MSKYKIISPIVIITVLFSAVGIATAWTGPTANPTGNNVAAPINVSASTQTKGGLLNASGLNATSIFSYKGYLGGTTNPPALNKILVSLNDTGVASWKSLQQIVQEVCSTPGSCPFLGGDSYWAVENDSLIGKVIANQFPADIKSLKIRGPVRILNKTDFMTEVNALNGVEFGFQETNYIPGKVSHVDVRSNLGIYGPDTNPSSNLNKRLVKIFDDLRVENNLSVVANIAAGDKVTAKQFCVKSATGGADVCSNTFGGASNVLNGDTDGQTIRWSTITNKWEPNSLFTVNLNQKTTEINNGSLVFKNSTGQVVGSVKSENDELAITGSPIGTFNVVRIRDVLATDFASVKRLLISDGAGAGKVLVSDKQGNASWQATTTLGIAGIAGGDTNWIKNGTSISNSNTGNVGIGTGVTAPSAKLDIKATGAGVEVLRLNTERPWTFKQEGSDSSTSLTLQSLVDGKAFNIKSLGGETVARFFAMNEGKSIVGLVPDGGNVGIGTNDPKNKLDVAGVITANKYIKLDTNPNNNEGNVQILSNAPAMQGGLRVNEYFKDGVMRKTQPGPSGTFEMLGTDNGATWDFYNWPASGNRILSLRINEQGNVGINTATPNAKLHVVGNALITGATSVGSLGVSGRFQLVGGTEGQVLTYGANGDAVWTDATAVGKTYGAGLNRGLELVGANNNFFAIKEGGVGTTEIKNGSITVIDLGVGSVSSTTIQDLQVTNADIANNAIGTQKIMDGGVKTDDIAPGNITADKLASMGAQIGQVLEWNGTTWAPMTPTTITPISYTVSPTGGLSLTNNAFAIKAKGVLASMLDTMGATKTGQVLKWNESTKTWGAADETPSGLPTGVPVNQTLRSNGTGGWIANGNGLLTNGVKVSIGTGNLASNKNLHVAGGISTDSFTLNSVRVGTATGQVLTLLNDTGDTGWRNFMETALFNRSGSTFTRQGTGDLAISIETEDIDPIIGGARDFVIMTCPSGYKAIAGGATCQRGRELSSSGHTSSARNQWRVSCGDALADIQNTSVTCAISR